jgi:hypothetical protein
MISIFRRRPPREDRVEGAVGFYLAALLSLLVSVDTSWRFFRDDLHITDLRERVIMFAVLEVGLLACGYGMRANVRRHGRPGAPRLFAWLLCAVSGYMAWQLSGLGEGIARVTLGPILGLVMLHLALGIEIKSRTHQSTTWTRVAGELRERLLSRLGLADDDRDALTRTQDRAADRAARLALTPRAPFRSSRLRRAVRTSGVALDDGRRERMLMVLAALRYAEELVDLNQDSPWTGATSGPSPARHEPGTSVTEPLQTFRGVEDHPAPTPPESASATEVDLIADLELDPPSPPVDDSSTGPVPVPRKIRTTTRSTRGTTAGSSAKPTDEELVALIRDHEQEHGPMSRRLIMRTYRVGSGKATDLLAAARNGQDHE